ncbi:hypothetical protein BH09SUM1_BH09SUM1_12890 [soil metagenome]
MISIKDFPEPLANRLDDLQFQYGPLLGKLAMAMDTISDAEVAAGQLALYCRNGLDPKRPHPDLESVQNSIRIVRALIKGAFRESQHSQAHPDSETKEI